MANILLHEMPTVNGLIIHCSWCSHLNYSLSQNVDGDFVLAYARRKPCYLVFQGGNEAKAFVGKQVINIFIGNDNSCCTFVKCGKFHETPAKFVDKLTSIYWIELAMPQSTMLVLSYPHVNAKLALGQSCSTPEMYKRHSHK